MKSWILLLASLSLVSARPSGDDSAAAAADAAPLAETSAAHGDVTEGTSKTAEVTENPRNWLALLLGEEQYTQPEVISQEAAARPKISGYGRRRRSDDIPAEEAAGISSVALDAVKIRNHGQYGELKRRQPLVPTTHKKTAANKNRQIRQAAEDDAESIGADVPLVDVDHQAVKIRNRGKYGNIAQLASSPAMISSRLVFDDKFGYNKQANRRRRHNGDVVEVVLPTFIPFSEYDARRFQILKLEQNDFLALPKRLADTQQPRDNSLVVQG